MPSAKPEKPDASDHPGKIALEVGKRETRETLARWLKHPWSTVKPWMTAAVGIALLMFVGAWVISIVVPQTPEQYTPIFTHDNNTFHDMIWILERNLMVLLLHTLVCVAAYLSRRAVPMQAKHFKGVNRWIHEHAGPAAMFVVGGLTAYSLCFQAWELGLTLHDAADTLNMSSSSLLMRAALHGVPELTAIFLPLAACLILGHEKRWNQLAAAAIFTAMFSVPILVATSAIETYITHGFF